MPLVSGNQTLHIRLHCRMKRLSMPRNQAIPACRRAYTTDQGSIPAEFCCGAHNEDLLIRRDPYRLARAIEAGCRAADLAVEFSGPVIDHDASDAAGDLLGVPAENFWRDHQSSRVNLIRTQTLIQQADIAVIRFGDKYKQWNAAFDAGYCAALGNTSHCMLMT